MTTSPSALDALLATLRTEDGVAKAHIDDGWMQGRTAYGGISSAVALAGGAASVFRPPPKFPTIYSSWFGDKMSADMRT